MVHEIGEHLSSLAQLFGTCAALQVLPKLRALPCPTPALCPSSAPSVPLPSLPGWTCPSLASWALTLPRTVSGAASPHPPAPLPCHSSPLLCSPVPCHECPSLCPALPLASNPRQKVLQVSIGNTTCTWIATSAPQVTKMPCPGLAGCSAGPQNSPESPFVVYLPLPPLRTNLSTWGASRQAMTHIMVLVASVPWHKRLSSATPPGTTQPKVTGDRNSSASSSPLWCQGN